MNTTPSIFSLVKRLIILALTFGIHFSAQAQGAICEEAEPFCIYEGVTYPATTNEPNAPFGNVYGCLATQPNPAWFYIEMDAAGALTINLSNSNSVDIDFALWGPYSDLPTALDDCGSLPAPVSCSYSTSGTETVQIPGNAGVGDIFILLVTNFSNQATEISAEAVTGNGMTSCDNVCIADGGVLNSPDLTVCEDDAILSLPPTSAIDHPDYEYTYIIAQGGTVVAVDPTPDLGPLGAGDYTVCGFSVNSNDAFMVNGFIGQSLSSVQADFAGNMDPFCGDFSDDCVDVTVGMAFIPIIIDEILCPGECIMVEGMEICSSTILSIPQPNGCNQDYNITLDNHPPNIIDDEIEKCPNACITYAFNSVEYCDAGSYTIDYIDDDGCDATIFLEVVDIITIASINPNPPPPLDCDNPSVILGANASDPSTGPFEWNGPDGFFSTDENIVVTEPGVYTLTVYNDVNGTVNPPCEDTDMVTVILDNGAPDIQVTENPLICLGESEDLDDYVFDLNNSSTITFHSNTPPNFSNQLPSSTVMPTETTTYYILATNGGCTDESEITVFVNDAPTADFTVDSPICLTDESTVTYTGTASQNAIYNWDFSAGSATPGFGQGPHTVSFPAAGTFTITLTVEDNGCPSEEVTMDIEVVAPLDPPVVMCDFVTTNSVQFSWNDVPGASGYTVDVVTGQVGAMTNNTTYLVQGLSGNEDVTIIVTAIGTGACGDAFSIPVTCTTEDCADVNLNIVPVDPICLDGTNSPFNLEANPTGGNGGGTFTWSGPAIIDASNGTVDPSSLVIGDNIFTLMYSEGDCDYEEMITIVGLAIPTADFSATSPLCVTGGSSTVTYDGTASANANYIWNFDGGIATPGNGQGPHDVTWPTGGIKTITLTVEEAGCFSEPFEVTVDVLEQLPDPVINCESTTNSIEFTWDVIPGADSYDVTVNTGQPGTMTGPTTFLVDGLMPGDVVTITVEAIGNAPCEPSSQELTCVAENCEPIVVNIDAVPDICLDGTQSIINLVATTDDATQTGDFEFGGSPAVTIDGVFDPNFADIGANTITVTYIEGNCTYNGGITINVFAQPTADFTADSPICETGISVINYSGNASSNAVYTWDFDGGNATPGTGAGPHQVDWDAAGTYTVTLMVMENGCSSEVSAQMVEVQAALEPLMINCSSTINSVTFTWNEIAGATGYNITDVTGPAGTIVDNTTYTVTGLSPDDLVTIMVEAISGGECPNVSSTADCTAENCDPIIITIDAVMPICLDANAAPFDLVANSDDVTPTGIFTFSGSPAVNATGTFDPSLGMIGMNMVTATYEEGDCSYNASIDIVINAQPLADFTVDSPICENATSTVTYTGTSGTGATYTWDFAGGNATSGTGIGPHTVDWPTAGTYTVTLTVEENGCTSTQVSQMVQVDAELIAPIISCEASTSTVEFIWNTVTGATGYTVNIISGQTGTMSSDTSFLFENLATDEVVNIELVIEGNTACGNITVPAMCMTTNCPPAEIEIINPSPICLTTDTGPITLQFTSDIQGDTICFSGTCIPNPKEPIFDPTMGGAGMNQVTVTIINGDCTYSESIIIEVIEPPLADFTATSPICVDGNSTVTYTGFAAPGSTFTWDFGGGTAVPGNGEGPHEVSWGTAGMQTISLMVIDNNGCASESNSVDVQVDAELIAPIIDCEATTSTVEFIWNAVVGATGYTVNVISGQTGMMSSDTSFLFTGLGTDEVVDIELVIEGNTACGNITVPATCVTTNCPPADITIINPSPICLTPDTEPITLEFTSNITSDSICWTGSCIPNPKEPIFDPNMGGAGMNQVTVTIVDGDCTYTESIIIEVIEPATADFTASSPICIDATSTVTYTGLAPAGSTFAWDFGGGTAIPGNGEGPHEVSWGTTGPQTISLTVTDDNGCASEPNSVDVQVDDLLPNLVINCSSTTTSVLFFWDDVVGATDYTVEVVTGETGVMTSDTSFEVTNLPTGTTVEIIVTTNGNTACGSITTMAECTALDCPTVTINITPVDDICLEGFNVPQDLEVAVMGNPDCVGSWSGQGIIDATNGTFDPIIAGIGSHVITYSCTDGPCVTTQTTTINVFAVPVADFTFTSPICESDGSTIEFSGMASASATYLWDFGGGVPSPGGNLPGPHTVVWASPGIHIVSLTVTDNGCTSETVAYEIEVQSPLNAPVIDCNTTTESIEFVWNNVTGASGYNVTVVPAGGMPTSDTSYLVTGLNPLDEVSITVEVIDNGPCPNVVAMTTCTAVDCPDVTIEIEPVGPFCFDGLLEQQTLNVTVTGGNNNGTETWSGPGITNPNDNVFDPIEAGVGNHQIVYTYTEDNCSYNEAINIEIIAAPNADAGLAMTLTCDEPDNVAQLGGPGTSVGTNIEYDWDTATGIPFPGDSTIANPVVMVPGVYTLTVTNTVLGCSSVSTVSVDANQSIPTPFISVSDADCFGESNGFLSVDTVENGTPPYLYSFNGGPLSSTSFFPNLDAGEYTIFIEDANGCSQELSIGVGQPDELNVDLTSSIEGDDQIIELGQGVVLTINSSIDFAELDSVQWFPAPAVLCDTCQTNTFFPTGPMTFSVTVYEGDCVASDQLTVFVSKDLEIYLPNVFSPNGDGENEVFYPQANEESIVIINSFLVFNRWGEAVYQIYNIPPNDINLGWDGTQRNKPLNPQVFVWFAEVVFIDGTTKIFKGDVTLTK